MNNKLKKILISATTATVLATSITSIVLAAKPAEGIGMNKSSSHTALLSERAERIAKISSDAEGFTAKVKSALDGVKNRIKSAADEKKCEISDEQKAEMKAKIEEKLAEAVANGQLTQEQADKILSGEFIKEFKFHKK